MFLFGFLHTRFFLISPHIRQSTPHQLSWVGRSMDNLVVVDQAGRLTRFLAMSFFSLYFPQHIEALIGFTGIMLQTNDCFSFSLKLVGWLVIWVFFMLRT